VPFAAAITLAFVSVLDQSWWHHLLGWWLSSSLSDEVTDMVVNLDMCTEALSDAMAGLAVYNAPVAPGSPAGQQWEDVPELKPERMQTHAQEATGMLRYGSSSGESSHGWPAGLGWRSLERCTAVRTPWHR